MISDDQIQVLDSCLEDISIAEKVSNKYFTQEGIRAYSENPSGFDFNPFKTYLSVHQKRWCLKCDASFDACGHKESDLTDKTVYTLDPTAISESVVESASRNGPLGEVTEKATVNGAYRCQANFSSRTIYFEFFAERDGFRSSDLNPLDLEFPVLLREFGDNKYPEYRFSWRELIHQDFASRLSSVVSEIKNSTTAVFAEYDEDFVSKHRTEIKSGIRDYFDKSGYDVYTEVSERCPEIEQYDIDAEYADFVCVNREDESDKILLSHGEARDGSWYAQRFVDESLVSVENEPIFISLRDQIEEKVRYYKSVSKQLSSSSKYMRGLAGVVAVVTALFAVVNISQIQQGLNSVFNISRLTPIINALLFIGAVLFTVLLVLMLFGPYVRERSFSWKMYPVEVDRPRTEFMQHLPFSIH
jgi:hypothetical protein